MWFVPFSRLPCLRGRRRSSSRRADSTFLRRRIQPRGEYTLSKPATKICRVKCQIVKLCKINKKPRCSLYLYLCRTLQDTEYTFSTRGCDLRIGNLVLVLFPPLLWSLLRWVCCVLILNPIPAGSRVARVPFLFVYLSQYFRSILSQSHIDWLHFLLKHANIRIRDEMWFAVLSICTSRQLCY